MYDIRCNLPCSFALNKSAFSYYIYFVKLRRGSGKDRQGMAVKAKGLKA